MRRYPVTGNFDRGTRGFVERLLGVANVGDVGEEVFPVCAWCTWSLLLSWTCSHHCASIVVREDGSQADLTE